jgi:hypothetical protein
MRAYTICNEYVELITNEGLVRCMIEGEGRNRTITLEGRTYLVSGLY